MWCGYLVAAADLFDTEPSAGPVGGAATLWLRSAPFQVAEDVLGHPGLVRLRWLGLVHPYAPGIFQTGLRPGGDAMVPPTETTIAGRAHNAKQRRDKNKKGMPGRSREPV